MRHCLKLSSLALLCLLASCAGPYRSLKPADAGLGTAMRYKPVFEKELYRCVVDGRFLLRRFHLSGVLLLKQMPDRSTRVVFQNEMGLSFFDFAWDEQDVFSVNQIIPQLNKPAVIATLEKDLRLLLMKRLDPGTEQFFKKTPFTYHRFTLDNGYAWYITENDRLERIENSGRRKKVVTITVSRHQNARALPEEVLFRHHRARFTIQLNKINQDVTE